MSEIFPIVLVKITQELIDTRSYIHPLECAIAGAINPLLRKGHYVSVGSDCITIWRGNKFGPTINVQRLNIEGGQGHHDYQCDHSEGYVIELRLDPDTLKEDVQ